MGNFFPNNLWSLESANQARSLKLGGTESFCGIMSLKIVCYGEVNIFSKKWIDFKGTMLGDDVVTSLAAISLNPRARFWGVLIVGICYRMRGGRGVTRLLVTRCRRWRVPSIRAQLAIRTLMSSRFLYCARARRVRGTQRLFLRPLPPTAAAATSATSPERPAWLSLSPPLHKQALTNPVASWLPTTSQSPSVLE